MTKSTETKAAAKVKRVAAMKRQRDAKELKLKAKLTAAHQKLAPIAKEINVRLDKATQALDKADDHRLAAALRLDEAKTMCGKSGVKFNEWRKDNVVEQSERTIRQLVAIGASKEPAKALADLREGNKVANKKLRDKKAAASKDGAGSDGPKVSTLDRASDMLGALQDDEARNTLGALAERQGMRMVTAEEAKRLNAAVVGPNFKDIMGLFTLATGSVQMEIVVAVCEATGTEITNEFDTPSELSVEDLTAIPAALDRSNGKAKKSRRKAA